VVVVKRALITGITGQDGSYLSELLLSRGYEVHGIVRRSSSINTARIDHIFDSLQLHHADMTDGSSLRRVLANVEPDEIYNLAAQSHVRVSFDEPELTCEVDTLGTLRLLEAVRDMRSTGMRVYQAGSSEMFGTSPPPQNERTPFKPCSPYGVAKLAAHWYATTYREAYGLFVCNGILFNHESPRRGETFVTRKITKAAARWAKGQQRDIALGNMSARRDWGFAGDYVEAMWLMMQQEQPSDYVIATGESHSVQEFYDEAFRGLSSGFTVRYDDKYVRPNEVEHLLGDSSHALEKLGWRPKTTFAELVRMMVVAES
jgi:GDPmannose 4,6-dehydratase